MSNLARRDEVIEATLVEDRHPTVSHRPHYQAPSPHGSPELQQLSRLSRGEQNVKYSVTHELQFGEPAEPSFSKPLMVIAALVVVFMVFVLAQVS